MKQDLIPQHHLHPVRQRLLCLAEAGIREGLEKEIPQAESGERAPSEPPQTSDAKTSGGGNPKSREWGKSTAWVIFS